MKEKRSTKAVPIIPEYRLDITDEVCPLTFVRTRLQLERMKPGQVLEIRLAGEEPLDNLPRALAEEGHEILSLEAETGAAAGDTGRGPAPARPHRLVVRKSA
jgi:TusA-related sulfurtransferase